MEKIDALIAAYNEEKTIKSIINILLKVPSINHIIVVDDGSIDKTCQTIKSLKSPKIILLKMPKNGGKSEAIVFGLKKITTKNIFLCDADLVKLTPEICSSIINPVIQNKFSMSIGIRTIGVTSPYLSQFLPSISGERALKTEILKKCIKSKYFYNYGMETVINYYCIINKLKTIKKVFNYGHINHLVKDSTAMGLLIYIKQTFLILKIYFIFFIKGWH